jgi:hypothetical protein
VPLAKVCVLGVGKTEGEKRDKAENQDIFSHGHNCYYFQYTNPGKHKRAIFVKFYFRKGILSSKRQNNERTQKEIRFWNQIYEMFRQEGRHYL